MISNIFLILLISFFLYFSGSAGILASPINISPDHWSYYFIERLQAKGILRDFLSNTKPYSRDEIARMIIYVDNHKAELNSAEKSQLDLLKREFAPELNSMGLSEAEKYRHLLDWSDGKKQLTAEIGYIQDATIKESQRYKSTLQVVLSGNLEGGLFFYNDSRASYEKSDDPLPIWHPFILEDRYPWNALSDAYLIFRLPWADVQLGKDAVLWGPGYHGVVGLSGVDPTFDIVRLPFKIWKVKFASIIGFLRDDLTREVKGEKVRKYLFAHRVEIEPFSGICIGWQEVYIYDKIHIELINPIMPYQMAEDYLGQAGNNTMEGDIDICLIPNTRFYTSLFLDDFHPNENFFTYPANTWAVLCGFLIVELFGIDNLDFRTEYARVEPWAYTHGGTTFNPPMPTSYKHFDKPLGHWMGSNADDTFYELKYQISKNTALALYYYRIRQGETGGNLYDYFRGVKKKEFLGGIIEKNQTVSLELRHRLFQDSFIEVNYSHSRLNNKQREQAKLPSYHPQKEPWKSGVNSSENAFQLKLNIRY